MTKEAEILKSGKLLIYPTDTIWGIGCDARNVSAIERIKAIKGRDKDKSFIVLVKDMQMLLEYVENIPPQTMQILEERQGLPTTILYHNVRHLPLRHLSSNEYLGIRIAETFFMQHLFDLFPYPVVSSSANFSGKASPKNFMEIDKDFLAKADYVSTYHREDLTKALPSSIFRIKNNQIEQIR